MAKNKTEFTEQSVQDFLDTIDSEQKKTDSYQLIEWMEKISGKSATMFGSSIIGFGKYSYKYDSGHSVEAPILGFSPRKAAISLYVYVDTPRQNDLLKDLGKFTMGKSCIYVKKLSDISEKILLEMMKDSVQFIRSHYAHGLS